MALRINDTIPNLTVETDQGTISLHDWVGDGWAVIFSHPKDFTPVCTTEFGAVAQLDQEWKKRGVKVLGVSVDGVAEGFEDYERAMQAKLRRKLEVPVAGESAETEPGAG